MVYIVPISEFNFKRGGESDIKKNLRLLKEIEKFRNSMKKTSDSVRLLREMRRYGR